MAWKILSALAAVCLAGSAFFAWKNQERLKNERAREEYTQKNLTSIQDHKKAAEEAKTKHTNDLAEATKELDKAKTEVADTAAKAQEKEQELAQIKTNLEGVSKVVKELQTKIDEAGDITKLMATIKDLENKKKEAEGALANKNQRLASAQENVKGLLDSVKSAEEREARGRKGIVEPDFTASVSRSFNEWGFVVLSKGNGGGVFANADLEVKRGKEVIGKLKVRNVEQNTSVADIIPGSVSEGASIRSGDLVVAAPQAQPAAKPATGAAPTAAPATPGAPAAGAPADPFGAPAAPAPAGGMAPASDPFGAPPAAPAAPPAAGGMAPASDPFGAPPAAPPAGGAGTPASPSTADPFGAPPAK
ncbi:MAG: hypothetical protein ACK5TH_06050 [Prosthecobacter sp.]|jgi:hypothetical protein